MRSAESACFLGDRQIRNVVTHVSSRAIPCQGGGASTKVVTVVQRAAHSFAPSDAASTKPVRYAPCRARRMLRRLASCVLLPILFACGDDRPGDISVDTAKAAVGIPVTIGFDATSSECRNERSFAHGDSYTCWPAKIALRDAHATCDDDACEVRVRHDGELGIVGRRAGPATVRGAPPAVARTKARGRSRSSTRPASTSCATVGRTDRRSLR